MKAYFQALNFDYVSSQYAQKGLALGQGSERLRGGVQAILGLAALLFLQGCHAAPVLTPQQAEGKHFYDVRCAHCHEDNDLALKKVPPNLRNLFARSTLPSGAPATDAEVRRVIMTGKGMMPSFAGRFSQDELDALLSYLRDGLR